MVVNKKSMMVIKGHDQELSSYEYKNLMKSLKTQLLTQYGFSGFRHIRVGDKGSFNGANLVKNPLKVMPGKCEKSIAFGSWEVKAMNKKLGGGRPLVTTLHLSLTVTRF